MRIDIISDTVCPWCYIGKKHLDQALATSGHTDVRISWKPFQLDPAIPAQGVNRKAYIERKFGPERIKSAGEAISEAGERVGIHFAFDKIERSPNTLNSHRLIHWAGLAGSQNEVVDLLFQHFFEQGADIGDSQVLSDIAARAGMNDKVVRERLESDTDCRLIELEVHKAREAGLAGVPCFVFEGRYSVVGAQDAQTFLRVFEKVSRKMEKQAGAAG